MDYQKHIKELSWELKLNESLNIESIQLMLTNLFELGKNAGKMELNAKQDIKIDTFNPFAH
jgi:hypothetical protein